jgi:L-amino acid N-acyltransferase YncA
LRWYKQMLLTNRTLVKEDYQAVRQIYKEGIQTGLATFEKEAAEREIFNKKYLSHSRLVVLSNQVITGWAALSPFSTREVYKGVAEVSIYIATRARGQGKLVFYFIKK